MGVYPKRLNLPGKRVMNALAGLAEKAASMNLGDLASKGADFAANNPEMLAKLGQGAQGAALGALNDPAALKAAISGQASPAALAGLAGLAKTGAQQALGVAGSPTGALGAAALGGLLSGNTGAVPNPGGMLGAYLGNKLKDKLAGSPDAAPAVPVATPVAAVQAAQAAQAAPVAAAAPGAAILSGLNGAVTKEQAEAAAILHTQLGLSRDVAIQAAQGAPTANPLTAITGALTGAGRKKRKTYRKKRAARKTGRKLATKPRRKL